MRRHTTPHPIAEPTRRIGWRGLRLETSSTTAAESVVGTGVRCPAARRGLVHRRHPRSRTDRSRCRQDGGRADNEVVVDGATTGGASPAPATDVEAVAHRAPLSDLTGRQRDVLTGRQRDVLTALHRLHDRDEIGPSLREVAVEVGLASVSSVHAHVRTLAALGLVQHQEGRPRTLRPAGPADTGRPAAP
ncbi:hypothetical protein FTX61_13455 [Nitriliruptoraceae bacterium ZYF776]|nr:hypothetical protein [Profundirhabdus halotolerans]